MKSGRGLKFVGLALLSLVRIARAVVVVDNVSTTRSYTEQAPAVPVFNPEATVRLTDVGDTLQSATFQLDATSYIAQDQPLLYADSSLLPLGVTATYLEGNVPAASFSNKDVRLVLQGLTAANRDAALKAVLFGFTQSNKNPSRTLLFRLVIVSFFSGTSVSVSPLSVLGITVDITFVNDYPVVDTGAPGGYTYTEDQAITNLFLVPNLTLSEPDTDPIEGVLIQPVTFFETSDTLAFSGTLPSWVNTSASGFVAASTSYYIGAKSDVSATAAQVQALLRLLYYFNTNQNVTDGVRNFSITVTDRPTPFSGVTLAPLSTLAYVNVSVFHVNDNPVLAIGVAADTNITYYEAIYAQSIYRTVAPSLAISDVDSWWLKNATVKIEPLTSAVLQLVYEQGFDFLRLPPTGTSGLTAATYNQATGTLTLLPASGSLVPLWAVQQDLKLVQYYTTSQNPIPGRRLVSFSVVDQEDGPSNVVTSNITVIPVNDPPDLSWNASSASFPRGGNAFRLQPNFAISDLDNTTAGVVLVVSAWVQVDPSACYSGVVINATSLNDATVQQSYVQSDCSYRIRTPGAAQPGTKFESIIRSMFLIIPANVSQRGAAVPGLVYKYPVSFIVFDGITNSTVSLTGYWDLDNFPPPGFLPNITAVTPSNTTGDLVTVTGNFFGPTDILLINYIQLGSQFCTSFGVIEENTKVVCRAPVGAGASLSARAAVNSAVGPLSSTGVFSYRPPVISRIDLPDTQFGLMKIYGYNFGPVGPGYINPPLGSVKILNSTTARVIKTCSMPNVTVSGYEITCPVGPGTGNLSGDIIVTVADARIFQPTQTSGTSGRRLFRYASPAITTVSKAAWFGGFITITGQDFGNTEALVKVFVGKSGYAPILCTSMTVFHTQITCKAPPAIDDDENGILTDADFDDAVKNSYDITIKVDGQTTVGTGALKYARPVLTRYSGLLGTKPNFRGGVLVLFGRSVGFQGNDVDARTTYHFSLNGYEYGSGSGPYANGQPTASYGTSINFPGQCRSAPTTSVDETTVCIVVPAYDNVNLNNGVRLMTLPFTLTYRSTNSNGTLIEFTNDVVPADAISSITYEGPVITSPVNGSQFGQVDNTDVITITGRNFAEDYQSAVYTNLFNIGATPTVTIGGEAVSGTDPLLYVTSYTQLQLVNSLATAASPRNAQGLPFIVNIFGQASTGGVFSYLGPIVSSATSPPTSGGVLTITGKRFGPTGTVAFPATNTSVGVVVCTAGDCSTSVRCTNPQVTVTNTQITCDITAVSALRTRITVTAGLMSSAATGAVAFSSAAPIVTAASGPGSLPLPVAGGLLTITGDNFGPVGTAYVSAVNLGSFTPSFPAPIPCSSPTVTVAHTELTCTVAALAGYGRHHDVMVVVANNNATRASSNGDSFNQLFNYAAPSINSIVKPLTSGSANITITGANFGNLPAQLGITVVNGANPSVTLDPSTFLSVTNTQLVISFLRQGTGSLTFTFVVGKGLQPSYQLSSGPIVTSYQPPIISGVNNPSFTLCKDTTRFDIGDYRGTNLLQINGSSFGGGSALAANLITITVADVDGDLFSTLCTIRTATHFQLVCQLQCQPFGGPASLNPRDLTVTVDGLTTTVPGNVTFEGPVVFSATSGTVNRGDGKLYTGISMFGGADSEVTVNGRNFGSNSDDSVLTGVDVCYDYTTVAACDTNAAWVAALPGTAARDTTFPGNLITCQLVSRPAAADTYILRVSIGNSTVTAGTGTQTITYLPPELKTTTDGYVRGYTVDLPQENELRPNTDGTTTARFDSPSLIVGFGGSTTNVFQVWWNISGSGFYDLVELNSLVSPSNIFQGVNPTVIDSNTFEMRIPQGFGIISWAPQFNCSDLTYNGFGYCPASTSFVTEAVRVRYAPPRVSATTQALTVGGAITITGTNFGPTETPVEVFFFTVTPGGVNPTTNTYATTPLFKSVTAQVSVAHTKIIAVLPKIPATLAGPVYVAVNASGVLSEQFNQQFSVYQPPVITTVSTDISTNATITPPAIGPMATQPPGVWLQITGTGFGSAYPNQASVQVYVGEPDDQDTPTALDMTLAATCQFPTVTINETELWCFLGQGSGGNYSVKVVVASEATTVHNVFSYKRPVVEFAEVVSFLGGTIMRVKGSDFGPRVRQTSGLPVLPVTKFGVGDVNSSRPLVSVAIEGKPCTEALVVADHYLVACRAPSFLNDDPIVGLNLTFEAGTLATAAFPSYNYSFAGPVITRITNSSIFGSTVTIFGSSLADLASDVTEVKLNGGNILLNVANPTVINQRTVMTITIPLDREVGLAGDGEQNILSFKVGSQYVEHSLDFQGPVINTTSQPLTSLADGTGDTLTLYGRNFGPVGATYILRPVLVDGNECLNPNVTVADRELECLVEPGSGTKKTVDLRMYTFSTNISVPPLIYTDQGTGFQVMRYHEPIIEQVLPLNATPGDVVTVYGKSFGLDSNKLSVSFLTPRGPIVNCFAQGYVTVGLVSDYTRVTCITPGNGGQLGAIVTMDGQKNLPFSYNFAAPTVTAVSQPSSGVLGGFVLLSGLNYGLAVNPSVQVDNVTFGTGVPCVGPTVITAQSLINCTIPEAKTTAYNGSFALSDLDGDGLMDVIVCINSVCTDPGNRIFAFPYPNGTALTVTTPYGDTQATGFVVANDIVSLTGRGFGTVPEAVTAYFTPASGPAFVRSGALNITGQASGGTGMTIKVPTGIGSVNFTVFINDRQVDLSAIQPRYNATAFGVAGIPLKYGPADVAGRGHIPPDSTRGGFTIIKGNGFGTLGDANIVNKTVYLLSTQVGVPDLTCINATVITIDFEVRCYVGPGSGQFFTPVIFIGGQRSTGGTASWSHALPIVTSVNVTEVDEGTYIQITGDNFGPRNFLNTANALKAYMYQPEVDPVGNPLSTCPGVPCKSTTMLNEHTDLVCVAPRTAGKFVPVYVSVNSLVTLPSNVSATVNYPAPILTNVTRSNTTGTLVTIVGNYLSHDTRCIASIRLAGRSCQGGTINMVTPHQVVQCVAPAGAGAGRPLEFNLTGNISTTGATLFSYFPPVITSINIVPTLGGQLNITGYNFGSGAASFNPPIIPGVTIIDRFGNNVSSMCGPSTVLIDHTIISCYLGMGAGFNYSVIVNISGQNSSRSGENRLRYRVPFLMRSLPQLEEPLYPDFTQSETIVTVEGYDFGPFPLYAEYMNKIKVYVGSFLATNRASYRVYKPLPDQGLVQLVFSVPWGQGTQLPITLDVDGQLSTVTPFAVFTYNQGNVTAVTPVSTRGGYTNITGRYLGPLGTPVTSVTINGIPCTSPLFIADNVISCLVPPGAGGSQNVVVNINGTVMVGTGLFSYRAPVIMNVTTNSLLSSFSRCNATTKVCQPGPTGQKIRIEGAYLGDFSTFGNVTEVRFCWPLEESGGNGYWVSPRVVLDTSVAPSGTNYAIMADVPSGWGQNLPVQVVVRGQASKPCSDLDFQPQQLFSYPAPIVLNTTNTVPSQGGLLTVTGSHFGPEGSSAPITGVAFDFAGRRITCQNGYVIVDMVRMVCRLAAGVGRKLDLSVARGLPSEIATSIVNYARPQLYYIGPSGRTADNQGVFIRFTMSAGTRLNVTGANFGFNLTLVTIYVVDTSGRTIAQVDPVIHNLVLSEPHNQLSFNLPTASGRYRTLIVGTPTGPPVLLQYTQFSNDAGKDYPYFDYAPPAVTAVSRAPTAGGTITVSGTGFGALNAAVDVTVVRAGSSLPIACSNAIVTVEDTQVTCTMPTGTGVGFNLTLLAFDQTNAVPGLFQYEQPLVTAVVPLNASGGSRITLTGSNFGNDASKISVMMGRFNCTATLIVSPHTSISCLLLDQGKGLEVEPVVTVDSNPSVPGVARFTYRVNGCTKPAAVNYDWEATDDDGSCLIQGCRDPTAQNFNPVANDPSVNNTLVCLQQPVPISMRIKLEFSIYLTNPSLYDSAFKTDVAAQLGISEDRINITSVVEGSTVFFFFLKDNLASRASTAATLLQDKLLTGAFTFSRPDMTLLTVVIDPTPDFTPADKSIKTRASEPRFSRASMIGIIVGGVVILIWAVTFRYCFRACCGQKGKKRKVSPSDNNSEDFLDLQENEGGDGKKRGKQQKGPEKKGQASGLPV